MGIHYPGIRFKNFNTFATDEDFFTSLPREKIAPNFCSYWMLYFSAWRTVAFMYPGIKGYLLLLPSYLFGIFCVLLKFFIISPPLPSFLIGHCRFEAELDVPGETEEARYNFMKGWYSETDRQGISTSSRFHSRKLPSSLWFERIGQFVGCYGISSFPKIYYPVMAGLAHQDIDKREFYVIFDRSHPHLLNGFVRSKSTKDGWVLAGHTRHLIGLNWIYEWIFKSVFGLYNYELCRRKSAKVEPF